MMLSVIGAGTIQADFDNVRLTAAAVPVAPALGTPAVSGGYLILTGAGGTPNQPYTWLSTTNLAGPLPDWITNSTGVLSPTGACSNAIPLSAPAQFFKLRLP
jgi:hypothetical protein